MAKSAFNKEKIDVNRWVDPKTGETLGSHYGEVTSINIRNNDVVVMKSESFYIMDEKASDYLEKILTVTELGYVTLMCKMAKDVYNFLHTKQNALHTKQTLMADLELARNAFNKLLAKLHRQGIIYYVTGYIKRKQVTHIMLNPFLSRKTNRISSDCYKAFQPLGTK